MKAHIKSLTILLAFLAYGNSSIAQYQIDLTGTITKNHKPIDGATIFVDKTTSGTFSDENGDFNLSFKSSDTNIVLIIRYTGIVKYGKVDFQELNVDPTKPLRINFLTKKKFEIIQTD